MITPDPQIIIIKKKKHALQIELIKKKQMCKE